MLLTINKTLERFMPLLTPTSVVAGVLLGQHLQSFTFLSTWLFAFMTFSGSLNSNFRDLKRVVTNPLPIFAVFFILHLLLPVISLGLGTLFFNGDSYTTTGFVLASVIPAGITSFIWVSIYGGNIPITLAFILLDSLLSPFVVPMSLSLLVGAKVHMDVLNMMKSLFWMIVLPSIMGMFLNQWTKGQIKKTWGPTLSPLSKGCVVLVVTLNTSTIGPYVTHISGKLVEIGGLLLFLTCLGYVLAILIGKILKWENDTIVSMTFNSGMRNSNAGTVLAVTYFPPPVAIPVVLALVYNQSLASFFGFVLKKMHIVENSSKSKTPPAAIPRTVPFHTSQR